MRTALEVAGLIIVALCLLEFMGFWFWVAHRGKKQEKSCQGQTTHEKCLYLTDSREAFTFKLSQISSIDTEVSRAEIILNSESRLEFTGRMRIE